MYFLPILPIAHLSCAEALYAAIGRSGEHNLTILLGPEGATEPTHVSMCAHESDTFKATLEAVIAGEAAFPEPAASIPGAAECLAAMERHYCDAAPAQFFAALLAERGLVRL